MILEECERKGWRWEEEESDVMRLELIRLKDTSGAVEEIGRKEHGEGRRREGPDWRGDKRLRRVLPVIPTIHPTLADTHIKAPTIVINLAAIYTSLSDLTRFHAVPFFRRDVT